MVIMIISRTLCNYPHITRISGTRERERSGLRSIQSRYRGRDYFACARYQLRARNVAGIRIPLPSNFLPVRELRAASQPLQRGCETRNDSTPREIVSTRVARANRFLLLFLPFSSFKGEEQADSRCARTTLARPNVESYGEHVLLVASSSSSSLGNKTRVSAGGAKCKRQPLYFSVGAILYRYIYI